MVDGLNRPWMGRVVPLWLGLAGTAACSDDSAPVGGSSSGPTGSADSTSSIDASSDEATSPDTSSDGSSSEGTGDPPATSPEPMGPGVSAGVGFTCSAKDGVITCWGEGECGQLGDGAQVSGAAIVVAGEQDWEAVDAGSQHACGIDSERALWCWGNGLDGRIGDGERDELIGDDYCRERPVTIAQGTTWARVAAGHTHTCGVQTDGTLWCWGSNDVGQIGDGSVGALYDRLVPTEVGGDFWLDVSVGRNHTCGLRSDHVVLCWGDGPQLGVEGLTFSSTPVELDIGAPIRALSRGTDGFHTCAIDEDDRVWCWGDNLAGQLGDASVAGTTPSFVPALDDVVEVAAGGFTTCARRMDGAVLCFGLGARGQLGDGVDGPDHTSATPGEVAAGTSFTSVTVSSPHSCARRDDGVDLCWGSNDSGEIGDGTSGPDNRRLLPTPAVPWGGGPVAGGWTSVELGRHHGCGTRNGGELWCWGSRANGELADDNVPEQCSVNDPDCVFTTPVAAAAGTWHGVSLGDGFGCAMRDDDTLWCWGSNDAGQLGIAEELSGVPVQIGDAEDWTAVDARGATVCGIRSPGTMWCWGDDQSGQLGQGSLGGDSPTPVQVGGDTDWIDVEVSSGGHVCGLRAGGVLSCWGNNASGQLGFAGDGEPVATPTVVAGVWSAIGLAGARSCAVADAGTMWCWGDGSGPTAEQIGDDADWASVASTNGTTCGLRTNGAAWCWGSNAYGQLGNGEIDHDDVDHPPTPVALAGELESIAVADSTFCALHGDGTAWCWGTNRYGEQGNDTVWTSGIPREVRDDA